MEELLKLGSFGTTNCSGIKKNSFGITRSSPKFLRVFHPELESLCALVEAPVFVHQPLCNGAYVLSRASIIPKWGVQHVHLEPHHIVRKRSISQPLRIKVFYDKSVYRLPPEKFEVINNTILPQALEYWQRTLLVRPMVVPIKLNRKCPNNQAFFPVNVSEQHCKERCENVTTCGEVVVPEEHLEPCRVCSATGHFCTTSTPKGVGIQDADFVFYVSAMQTDRCHKGQTVAYAAHCQQEAALDRPIAGHANLCPNSISTKPQDLDTLLSTVKHEILHALGFSVSLYAYFRDKSGYPLTPRGRNGKPMVNKVIQAHQWSDRVIREVERRDWRVRGNLTKKTVKIVVTPRVQEEIRWHFNCSYLEGAELEDQGEDGTVLTHWEKRLFENEAMTGTHTQNPVYSRITLALMEDTGWYMPNYAMAQELKWGKNLGCDFAFKSCKDWIDTRRARGESIHPYCDKVKKDPLETECTDSRDSVALCNLVEYPQELPNIFQNFDYIPGIPPTEIGKYGGSVSLADYCPYIQEFTWKSNNIVVRGSQCQFPENMPQPEKNFALEYYGSGSKCFNHNKEMWEERTCSQVRQWQHWGSGCYRYECASGHLNVIVANHTYTCFHAGQQLKIQIFFQGWLHIGTIVCPPCHEICGENDINCQPDSVKSYYASSDKKYYFDELPCGSMCLVSNRIAVLLLTILFFYLGR
ncbi:leishmanolysin-like peptidase [Caerostris darwini]|uniref:Leishmanolysin-like peptidase n=1 Tax=Caerostris darwini TaxID=1538125 RepID=A0AAV4WIM8_9ARAC|nr:leishmanolysin-like peptidase [Caerostris darwini]